METGVPSHWPGCLSIPPRTDNSAKAARQEPFAEEGTRRSKTVGAVRVAPGINVYVPCPNPIESWKTCRQRDEATAAHGSSTCITSFMHFSKTTVFNVSGVAIIEHFKFLYQLLSSQCAEVPALIPVTNQVNFEVGHLDAKQFLQGKHGTTVWVTYVTMVQPQLS